MAAALTLLTISVAIQNATRVVHRHACYGADIDSSAVDNIGCAESAAAPLEHMLTPDILRCNDTHCMDRFGMLVDMHSMNCTERFCTIKLHCNDRLSDIIQATIVGMIGVIALIVYNTIHSTARPRSGVQKNL